MADRHARQNPDAQARAVISAMHGAARRFRRRRDHLLHSPERDRPRLTEALIADIDRLANLMSLLQTGDTLSVTPETRDLMASEVERVRRYVTHIGLDVALDRIREIRATAEAHCAKDSHPLGKSIALREGFLRYVTYLRTLAESLSDQHLEDLRASAEGINRLTARDRESPWLQPFSPDEKDVEVIADIDLVGLEMDVLARLARRLPEEEPEDLFATDISEDGPGGDDTLEDGAAGLPDGLADLADLGRSGQQGHGDTEQGDAELADEGSEGGSSDPVSPPMSFPYRPE